MESKRIVRCLATAAFVVLAARAAPTWADCAAEVAATDTQLSALEADAGNAKSQKAKTLYAARRLLTEAREAFESGKKKRCEKKLEAARSKMEEVR